MADSDVMAESVPEPVQDCPELSGGLSSTPVNDKARLAEMVVKALSDDPGWAAIKNYSSIDITDKSGLGGSKTFKVVAPIGSEPLPSPRAVALHILPRDHKKSYMQRMSKAAFALGEAGVAPKRIVEGSDWYLEPWESDGKPPAGKPQDWYNLGLLLARVHQVPVEWFEKCEEEIVSSNPQASATPKGSHAWLFLVRIFPCKGCLKDAKLFAEYADPGPMAPVHPIASRIVTAHGDFHPNNVLDIGGDSGLKVIDFEFTCVTSAVFDLAFAFFFVKDPELQDAFLTGYSENLGGVTDLEMLKVDCLLARLFLWLPGGMLPAWEIDQLPDERARLKIKDCKEFAGWIRESKDRQKELIEKGFEYMLRAFPPFKPEGKMQRGTWYPLVQSKLEAAVEKEGPSTEAFSDLNVTESIAGGADLLMIKARRDQTKALQVRPGTSRLELGDFEVGCRNQQWLRFGNTLQHVGTALFLDAEVKYMYHDRGQNWESCGGELFVRPKNADSGRQDWILERSAMGGHFIRHMLDGRTVDVNFWSHQKGHGVNVNVPHATAGCVGILWALDGLKEERPVGTWAEYSNIDMCGQGDVRIIPDWTNVTTLEELKMTVENRDYSAITVSAGVPSFGHAALKKFDYPLTPEHCRPITECCNHPCTIHIWSPSPSTSVASLPSSRAAVPTIAPELPEGACFSIRVACSRDYCLSYRADGYTKDPYEVYLARFDGSAKQRWRLVGGDQIQNVDSERFLHTEVLYPILLSLEAPWEGNHSDLVLREQDFSDRQRWVFGPEEFHGGKVLRHYKDGRSVDVHGWQVDNDGNNVGCENSVHSDCKGASYIFEVWSPAS
eukprot:TRINITY_DN62361_c0_g1_i1.p1 TRINITY_DN62361_c0_g1~~TRINITY_DN62361_c0_g1_i1.p1  ORF type:complete len:861 (-),score=115.43 TRINITY_DN62361_c0_g1_i1:180-2690(-)